MKTNYYLAYKIGSDNSKQYLWQTLDYNKMRCMEQANLTLGSYPGGKITFEFNEFRLTQLTDIPMFDLIKDHLKEIEQTDRGKECLTMISVYMHRLEQQDKTQRGKY